MSFNYSRLRDAAGPLLCSPLCLTREWRGARGARRRVVLSQGLSYLFGCAAPPLGTGLFYSSGLAQDSRLCLLRRLTGPRDNEKIQETPEGSSRALIAPRSRDVGFAKSPSDLAFICPVRPRGAEKARVAPLMKTFSSSTSTLIN